MWQGCCEWRGLVVWRADPWAYWEGESPGEEPPGDEPPYPDVRDPIGDAEWARIMGKAAVHSSGETLQGLESVRQAMNSLTLAKTLLPSLQRIAMRQQREAESGRVDRGPDFNPSSTPDLVKDRRTWWNAGRTPTRPSTQPRR